MSRFERKLCRPVVQQDSGVSGDHAGTKHVGETGDERDRVAILVDDREIGGVSAELPAVGTANALSNWISSRREAMNGSESNLSTSTS